MRARLRARRARATRRRARMCGVLTLQERESVNAIERANMSSSNANMSSSNASRAMRGARLSISDGDGTPE